ncbi:MAG: acyl-CoA dehydrogenase family protein [Nocardioidaceae bacterium]
MSHYKSNIRDIEFNLFEVLGSEEVLGSGPFEEIDTDTARSILAEVDRLARDELAASFEEGDRTPPTYDPKTCSVTMNRASPRATRRSWTPSGTASSCPPSSAANRRRRR